MHKIAISVGTIAELIKMSPVMRLLEKNGIDYTFIHTGQHDFNKDLLIDLEVKKPDFSVQVFNNAPIRGRISSITNLTNFFFNTTFKINNYLKKKNISLNMVHGDTLSTLVCSLATKIMTNTKLAHIEAGLRSFDFFEPFPEEIIRFSVDQMCDIAFCPTKKALYNIKNKKNAFVTGNTVIDALIFNLKKHKIKVKDNDYIIAKIHRVENLNNKFRIKEIYKVLKSMNYKTIFIMFPNTKNVFESLGLLDELKKNKNIIIYDFLLYKDFLKLFANCKLIITDSGGEVEEATYLKKPVISFRKKSERLEAEEVGIARRSINSQEILKLVDEIFNHGEIYKKAKKAKCPYGEGKAAFKIISHIKDIYE
ncbi:MAG: UDP-N-acetylglucosamine 2-epimerase (non-hydrolyzing) [Candidatus Anstonellales archaeon]